MLLARTTTPRLDAWQFVHRDLAARNVLVDLDMTLRVADFGLSRLKAPGTGDDSESDEYRSQNQGTFPVRWTAPEAIETGKYNEATDVWSFGIVMVEIFTNGARPYSALQTREVINFVAGGGHHERPPQCPPHVYDLALTWCWSEDARARPRFKDLKDFFSLQCERQRSIEKHDGIIADARPLGKMHDAWEVGAGGASLVDTRYKGSNALMVTDVDNAGADTYVELANTALDAVAMGAAHQVAATALQQRTPPGSPRGTQARLHRHGVTHPREYAFPDAEGMAKPAYAQRSPSARVPREDANGHLRPASSAGGAADPCPGMSRADMARDSHGYLLPTPAVPLRTYHGDAAPPDPPEDHGSLRRVSSTSTDLELMGVTKYKDVPSSIYFEMPRKSTLQDGAMPSAAALGAFAGAAPFDAGQTEYGLPTNISALPPRVQSKSAAVGLMHDPRVHVHQIAPGSAGLANTQANMPLSDEPLRPDPFPDDGGGGSGGVHSRRRKSSISAFAEPDYLPLANTALQHGAAGQAPLHMPKNSASFAPRVDAAAPSRRAPARPSLLLASAGASSSVNHPLQTTAL